MPDPPARMTGKLFSAECCMAWSRNLHKVKGNNRTATPVSLELAVRYRKVR